MYLRINTTPQLSGTLTPPSSKSHSIRALFVALLASGRSHLSNVLSADDTADAIAVCQSLGAHVSELGHGEVVVYSPGLPLQTDMTRVSTGNSGITTHFALPIIGLRGEDRDPVVVDCGEQMRARPISSLVTALRRLGMGIEYVDAEGVFPLAVHGSLRGGRAEVNGITSQYLSALLLSLPCAPQDSEIIVRDLHERPYVDITMAWLHAQNIEVAHQRVGDIDVFRIPGNQRYRPFARTIPADFSSASALIAAAVLVPGEIELRDLDMSDPQGDKRLVSILQEMGADIRVTPLGLRIRGGNLLHGMTIDASDIPDLVPALAVVGSQASGGTNIRNVSHARIKETDRIHSMIAGLTRLGARCEEHRDGLSIAPSILHGSEVDGYGDHRTVMALGVAGMVAQGTTVVSDVECVAKTYPGFVGALRQLGANVVSDNAGA